MNRFLSSLALAAFLALATISGEGWTSPLSENKQPGPKTAAEKWLDTGIECYRKCSDAKAVEMFDKAVQADAKNAFALAMRGVARAAYAYYGYEGDEDAPREGSPRLRAAPFGCGPGQRVFIWVEERERTRKDLKLALGDVEKAVDLDRVDERLWICRGVVYLWRSDIEDIEGTPNMDKALESFGQALLLNAECRDIYFYRAWAHLKMIPAKTYSRFWTIMSSDDLRPTREELESSEILDALKKFQLAYVDIHRFLWPAEKENIGGFLLIRNPDSGDWGVFEFIDTLLNDAPARYDAKLKRAGGGETQDITSLFRKAAESVVLLSTENAIGSGFFAADGNMILTNAHVVKGAKDGLVKITFYDGSTAIGHVHRVDEKRDIAAVVVDQPKIKGKGLARLLPLEEARNTYRIYGWYPSTPLVGDKVIAIGHPKGLSWSMTSGVVSAFRVDPNEGTHIQTDTALNPGNSGGPVLDLRGGIVGMAVSILVDSEGLNFAIAGSELFDFDKLAIFACPRCQWKEGD
ncbi:MAG: hypothetical protein A2Z25_14400 [Planctomycetes bacterium RBG_16_55_9]|nr:MAG: hypothetical protein A2Z25_14400 [Planctomycetes bacterium RBG_16_55_9]